MNENGMLLLSLLPIIVVKIAWKHVSKSQLENILKPSVLAFVAGYFFKMGLDTWRQDIMGLEGYISMVREYWVDVPVIVGILISAFALLLFAHAIRKQKSQFLIGDKCAGKNDL